MKKFKWNWQSMAVGLLLCAVLFVFVASRAAQTEVAGGNVIQKTTTLSRAANLNDIWEQLDAMDKRLTRIEKKIDQMNEDKERVFRVLKYLEQVHSQK